MGMEYTVFDYWRLDVFAGERDRIYGTYCKEIEHLRKYYPWMSDSTRRRQAIANLTEDWKNVLSDFMKVVRGDDETYS